MGLLDRFKRKPGAELPADPGSPGNGPTTPGSPASGPTAPHPEPSVSDSTTSQRAGSPTSPAGLAARDSAADTSAPAPAAPAPAAPVDPLPGLDSNSLRDMLIAAFAARDGKLLLQLAAANRPAISQNFADWQRVPESIRNNPDAMQRYAGTLIALAEMFRDRFQDASLMAHLAGTSSDNPLAQWEAKLRQADALSRELRFEEAKQLLTATLIDMRDVQSGGPVSYQAVTHGRLAHTLFSSGDIEGARGHMLRALELSSERGDAQGTAAGLRGMYEVLRYEGKFKEAADYADKLAAQLTTMGNADDARNWSKQAARVRAGEPLCRIVFFVNDRQFEADEMPRLAEARVRYGFCRNRPALALCEGLVQRAMQAGGKGNFDEALAGFREAAKVDPFDPNPHYHAAVTLMHLEQPSEAFAEYDATEELAPGWFNCRGERWLAAEIAGGRVEQAVFFILRTEEMPEQSASWEHKLGLADEGLAHAPDLALLHLYRGKCLMNLNRIAEAQAAFTIGLAHAPEPDIRTRLLFELQVVATDPAEKIRLLREAADLNGNLGAAAVARVALGQMESAASTIV